jgi:hypothetical protein
MKKILNFLFKSNIDFFINTNVIINKETLLKELDFINNYIITEDKYIKEISNAIAKSILNIIVIFILIVYKFYDTSNENDGLKLIEFFLNVYCFFYFIYIIFKLLMMYQYTKNKINANKYKKEIINILEKIDKIEQ